MTQAAALAFFRQADWLTPRRVRAYAMMLGLASVGVLAMAFAEATGRTGSDFLAFWGAGQVVLAGDPALAYDLAVQERVQTATGSAGWFAFVNPPPFLFAAAPFGALPFPLAWAAWVAVTFALWAWASVRAFPRLWPLVFAYPGALVAATHAQTGLLTGALLVAAVSLLTRRPLGAGAAIGALVIKPHLALLLPFWLAAGGRWRAFLAAGASVAALLLASWAVFGSATFTGYIGSWDASAALMARSDPDFFLRMTTIYSQVRVHLGDAAAWVGGAVCAAAIIALSCATWKRSGGDPRAAGAAMLAMTALASPYLFAYDLPFLIFPTLWLVERGLAQGFRAYEKLALVALYLAPYATRALAFPLGVNLMPLAALGLVCLVWSRGGQVERLSHQSHK